MYSSRSAASVGCWSTNCAVPFHVGKNSCHQAMSARASLLRRMWWCSLLAFVLSVIRRLKNSLPTGTACAANASLPISESSFHFIVLLRDCHLASSSRISLSLSGGRRICRKTESNSRPKKGRTVTGPSTFSMATGKPRSLHTLKKHCRCSLQL